MRKLKLFFACLLMAVLGYGQMWGDPTNATMATGTQASSCTVNGKAGIKVGTGQKTGDMTITVGEGATTLTFYAALWNNTSGTLNVSAPSGVTVTSTISPSNNSGISGNSPFTLSAGSNEEDYKIELTLSGVESSTAITIASTNSTKRFVVWSATYETSGGGTQNPTIFTNPVSAKYAVDATATALSVEATASAGNLHYQWKSNTTNSTENATNVGIDAATFTPSTANAGTTYYFCEVTDDNGSATSSIAEVKVLEPQTDMDQIFAVASADNGVAKPIAITFNNWVVSGAKGKTAYVTDGEKGFIIFYQDHGFAEGNILSGTAIFTIKLYNGAAELTEKISGTVNAATGGTATLNELDAEGIADLGGVNTGALIKISGTCSTTTGSSTKYYIGEDPNKVQLYTTLHDFTSNAPTSGKDYNCTGVYVQFNSTKEIMPRKADDIQLKTSKTLSSISLSGTYPTEFEQDDAFSHAGMTVTAHYTDESTEDVTASATFTGYDMSATGEQTVTVSYTENTTQVTTTYTINVNTPTPTGDFELFEGALTDLEEGDYLIYDEGYQGSLMLAEIASDRFNYELATPDANGIISNPSGYAVWTLAKSGDYWTFYNAKAGKYTAGTGVNNKGQLISDGTSDYAKWSISDEFVITNKGNADASKNATLRHNYDAGNNKNYGFACYAANTGHKPVFYKQATPSYYITEDLTGCSAADGNATKVPQALTEDVVLKYNLATGYVWPNAITVQVGATTLNENYTWDVTKTPAELTINKDAINGDIVVTIVAQLRELDYITVKEVPTKTAYFVGDFFNPAGLEIQLNYTAGDPETVIYNDGTKDDFSFSPNLETALTADDDEVVITYAEKSVSQTISVTVPTPEEKKVVIIAEYDSKFYAMSNTVSSSACTAIEVTKDGANLVAASDDDKAAIQWLMTTTGNNVTFQNASDKYLSSVANDGALSLVDGPDNINWSVTEEGGEYLIAIGDARALLYRTSGLFKHYATSNLTQHANEYFKVSEIFEVAEGATNIVVVTPVVREFVVEPDEDVAFGTVEQGETVDAKSFEVTLTNISSATVTLEGGNGAFSIDKSTLDENGGTITITPNTATAGNFSATITLSDVDGQADDKVINVTMRVVAPKDCDRTDDFGTVGSNSGYSSRTSTDGWKAVNTAVAVKDDVTYWIMQGNTNSVGVITSPEFNYGIKELSLSYYYPFSENHGISFKIEIKQNGSVVKEKTITKADAIQNTIYEATFEEINVEGKFQIVFTNLSPSNSTSSKDRFAVGNLCWKNYGDPVYEELREGAASGKYYTVCLKKKVVDFRGGNFWKMNQRSNNQAYLVEATVDELLAGTPFLFDVTGEKLEVVYEGADATETVANGALRGLLNETKDQAGIDDLASNLVSDIYMLKNNELRKANGQSGNSLGKYKAYIVYNDLENVDDVQPAPGRRVRAIPMQSNVVTGCDEINASETPVKMMIDGQLFIIRGEKMYDTTGRLVK